MIVAVGRQRAVFVLGDVVGSTRRWEEDPDAMPAALAHLDRVLDAATAAHGGERPMEQGEGDSFVVTFATAGAALAFALDVQRSGAPLPVRIAVHTGEAERRDDGRWLGGALNRAARIRALAAGGQILVSATSTSDAAGQLPGGASLADLGHHRLRDLTEPEQLHQLCHPDLPSDFPDLVSTTPAPTNLPVDLSSFVGRAAELEEVAALLTGSRLVTLTGAGGCGKTRLAIEVAARNARRWPSGVWVVDLASTGDPALVAHAVAAAVGAVEQHLQPMLDSVVARLADARALLLLDNCEHLLDAAGELVEALARGCSDITILATSREALGVAGEVAFRVPSLEVPRDEGDLDCEAVRLFVDRARSVRPTFALDDANRSPVAALCRRLDGLPLAIELAASRCRSMAPSEIAEQLHDRFRILTSGRRAAVPRQRTLEASVRWSHDLLSEPERAVLRRLSVFAGGFSLAGAERVGALGDDDALQVLDLLTSLVDKSLVHAAEIEGRTRYRLLETIRVFVGEELAAAGELDTARDRHLTHMVAVAEASGFELFGRPSSDRFLELEIDNLRAARDWGIDRADADRVLRLLAATGALWEHWLPQELLRLGSALEVMEGGSVEDRTRLLFELCTAALLTGDGEGAAQVAGRAGELAAATGDERVAAVGGYLLALCSMAEGEVSAVEEFDAAITELRLVDAAPFYLGSALWDSANMLLTDGRIPEGLGRMAEAMDVIGLGEGSVLGTLLDGFRAGALPRLGRIDDAEAAAARVLTGRLRMPSADTGALLGRALVLSARGEHDAALEAIERAVSEAKRYAVVFALLSTGGTNCLIRTRAGLPLDAALLAELEALAGVTGLGWSGPGLQLHRCVQALGDGDVATAATVAERALSLAAETAFASLDLASLQRTAAKVALAQEELGRAEDFALAALTTALGSGQLIWAPEALETLAQVAAALESHDEAARLLGMATGMRRRLGWCPGRDEERTLAALRAALADALGSEALGGHLATGAASSDDQILTFASRGRGERKRPSFGWDGLTPTEREVVELVAEGLRNKDVAAKLVMSPATVKTHLTHVFAKLGMSSRGELIAAVARRRG